MKKALAALAAAVLLCCTLISPVSAEETCQMGDVNMDGVVDLVDSQLVLEDFTEIMCRKEGILSEEQRVLGNVDGAYRESYANPNAIYICDVVDSQLILLYYVTHMCNPETTMEDVTGQTITFTEAWQQYRDEHKNADPNEGAAA